MLYYLDRVTGYLDIEEIVTAHEIFFYESIYKNLTWDRAKAEQTIRNMIADPDSELIVAYDASNPDHEVCGFFEFGYENPWMEEEVALCINFYVLPWHRSKECSQKLLDFGIKLCQDRGAKLAWQSSTAGFSDNGVNERAFTMFLKRNGFREIGTLLVREISADEQNQKSV